ncbi:Protein of unknown function [Micromonospora pattaloongensis]|uniref:DUF4245 domain-containing protein n=2 Tax=Micromonospora pattaloongensis TaxID=405436 RepID=A0A1H3G9E7_9ACTN|nr:Protein of unknown function [Micromonospora pattaloongensis]
MAISLLVILLPIAVLFAAHRFLLNGDQPVVVDPAPAVAQARSANAFPVSEPRGLGEDWRSIAASFRQVEGGRTLRIGYVTPKGAGVQLVQSTVPVEKLLPAELSDSARPEGPIELGGRNWLWYAARPGERALVLLEPARTLVIVGDAPETELTTLAATVT